MDDRAGDSFVQLILRNLTDPAAPIVFVQPGVTFGSDVECTVNVREPAVRGIHARVVRDSDGEWRLKAETGRPIMLPEGRATWDLPLTRGVVFAIGSATFGCDESIITTPDLRQRAPVSVSNEPERTPPELGLTCATCQRIVATLPVAARFCPRCGTLIPENRPDLTFLADALSRPPRRGLLSRLLPIARGDSSWRLHGRRPATLIAYVNTLVNLARQYQAGRGGDRNVDQALRYYEKAAKLGSGVARQKLNEQSDQPPYAHHL